MNDAAQIQMKKRTLSLAGHQTSLALEPEFWDALTEIAEMKNKSWSELIAEIDAQRVEDNLASAVRLAILRHYQDRLALLRR